MFVLIYDSKLQIKANRLTLHDPIIFLFGGMTIMIEFYMSFFFTCLTDTILTSQYFVFFLKL